MQGARYGIRVQAMGIDPVSGIQYPTSRIVAG